MYIEQPDRSSGIKMVATGSYAIGDLVDVSGTVVLTDGERVISNMVITTVQPASDTTPKIRPVFVRNACLG
jgi:hypothetical protein